MARWLALLGGALTLALAPAARASPADLFGFGPRSQAMGGTGAAVASGFEATYLNPALLSQSHSRELTLGWQSARFSLHATGPNAPGDVHPELMRGTFIGAVLPLPFAGVLERRLTLGVGAFTPRQLVARARLLYPERPQFPVLADRAQTLSLNMGLGIDLGHGVRIGGGALALAELVGGVRVQTDASGRVGTLVDDQLVASYAPIVGASLELDRGLRFGLVWRGALVGDFDVVVRVEDLGALVMPDLHISGIAQYDPMQVQAEAAKQLGAWTFVIGATYKRWSDFPGWARATVVCPETQPDCDALVPAPVDFHDTIVPRVGLERELELSPSVRGELRAGLFFEPTPTPEQSSDSNYWDNSRVAIGIGWGTELEKPLPPLFVSFFYQHQILIPRTHRKNAGVSATNAGFPSVETGGSVQNTGAVVGVKF